MKSNVEILQVNVVVDDDDDDDNNNNNNNKVAVFERSKIYIFFFYYKMNLIVLESLSRSYSYVVGLGEDSKIV